MHLRKLPILTLVAAYAFLTPAFAQRPAPSPGPGPGGPAPAPTPGPTPGRTPNVDPSSQPIQPNDERLLFILGRVKTDDGSPIPTDMIVERVCNARVRQQVYASSQGDFSMQLNSAATTAYLDASGEASSQFSDTNKDPAMGMSKHELMNCELRATASGFRPSTVNLYELSSAFSNTYDVGAILVHHMKAKGATVSALPYKLPNDARRAFEKGLAAQKNGNLANARQYFQKSVDLYPKNAMGWFQLGTVLQKQDDKEGARKAYTQATVADPKFLPPFLSLSHFAYRAEDWRELRELTAHILDVDPVNYARVTGDIVDLDSLNYTSAYFYNAVANYKLNRFEEAEKSALKAERLGLRGHSAQLHLILADTFAKKANYSSAIAQLQSYLQEAPESKLAVQARERLAHYEQLNASASNPGGKPNPN